MAHSYAFFFIWCFCVLLCVYRERNKKKKNKRKKANSVPIVSKVYYLLKDGWMDMKVYECLFFQYWSEHSLYLWVSTAENEIQADFIVFSFFFINNAKIISIAIAFHFVNLLCDSWTVENYKKHFIRMPVYEEIFQELHWI